MKVLLRAYRRENIRFNEPHFTTQLMQREGDRETVIEHLHNPERLIGYERRPGKYGDQKLTLFFKLSNTRTMILPVICGKSLYVLTYILRHRRYQR
jgi:hypothetical protein